MKIQRISQLKINFPNYIMNQIVVDKIVQQLNRVNDIAEVKQIVEEKHENLKNFSADYLVEEFRKISHAKEKSYPTHRSEYRVTATLLRLRNEILYELNKISPTLLLEFVELSKLLTWLLKSVGGVFENEKTISNFAEEFDNTWYPDLKS